MTWWQGNNNLNISRLITKSVDGRKHYNNVLAVFFFTIMKK